MTIIPTEIRLHKKTKILDLSFNNGSFFQLPCEYLRVFSPSAKKKEETLTIRRKEVSIINIEPIGSYAVKLIFDDGHSTGLYTWESLYNLSINFQLNWKKYLSKIDIKNK